MYRRFAWLYPGCCVGLLLLPPAPAPAANSAGDEIDLLAAVHAIVSPYRQKMLSYWVRPRDYEGFAEFLQLGGGAGVEYEEYRDEQTSVQRASVPLPAIMLFQSQRFNLYRFTPSASSASTGLVAADVAGPEGLGKWLSLFWRQGIEPLFKTQDPFPTVLRPLHEVQQLTGDTFSGWASNRSRDALIAVTKQGCPHCAKFAPVYEALAAELGAERDIEATANEIRSAPLVFGAIACTRACLVAFLVLGFLVDLQR